MRSHLHAIIIRVLLQLGSFSSVFQQSFFFCVFIQIRLNISAALVENEVLRVGKLFSECFEVRRKVSVTKIKAAPSSAASV